MEKVLLEKAFHLPVELIPWKFQSNYLDLRFHSNFEHVNIQIVDMQILTE